MSATIHDSFVSRRGDQLRRGGCSNCASRSDGQLCYPHRLDSLADRLRNDLAATRDELLVPSSAVAESLADALAVLNGITDECLTPTDLTRRTR